MGVSHPKCNFLIDNICRQYLPARGLPHNVVVHVSYQELHLLPSRPCHLAMAIIPPSLPHVGHTAFLRLRLVTDTEHTAAFLPLAMRLAIASLLCSSSLVGVALNLGRCLAINSFF